MLHCQFLCHVLKALFFTKIALKLSYFTKKMQDFRALGAEPPDPRASGGWGQGVAPRPPLVSGGWDPQTAPPLRISGYAPAYSIFFSNCFENLNL